MIGVYWGRFNPPHNGHLKKVEELSKKIGKLIVVVGSAQEENTNRNPFSGIDRKEMFELWLSKNGNKNVSVITLNDGPTLSNSVKIMIEKTKCDILFTDKKYIGKLAQKMKVDVNWVKRKGKLSSTKLRHALNKGEEWKHMTDEVIAEFIQLKSLELRSV